MKDKILYKHCNQKFNRQFRLLHIESNIGEREKLYLMTFPSPSWNPRFRKPLHRPVSFSNQHRTGQHQLIKCRGRCAQDDLLSGHGQFGFSPIHCNGNP